MNLPPPLYPTSPLSLQLAKNKNAELEFRSKDVMGEVILVAAGNFVERKIGQLRDGFGTGFSAISPVH